MSSAFFLCILSAIFLALPFLFPVTFPLAWFAFVPIFRVVQTVRGERRALLFGWLAGALANLIGFYWLVYTVRVFGGFSYGVSAIIYLLFGVLEGIQVALFALLICRFGPGPFQLFPPLFWIALEFWFPLLFPWHLASTQTAFLSLIQSADLVGPYGTSFLVMWGNSAIYRALVARGRTIRKAWMPAAALGCAVIGVLVYGQIRLTEVAARMGAAPTLTLAAVQGNIDVGFKWDPLQMRQNLKSHQDLTRRADGVPLVIWPETAIEEWVPESIERLPDGLFPRLESGGAHFIFGARSFRGTLSGPDFKAFNTAFLADGDGRVLKFYHKQVLLAFGEYIPFSGVLSRLPGVPPLAGFTAGEGPQTLDLPGGIKIAPLICYEDLMPELARGFVTRANANVLVNLTNDAWYGKSAAPWQHAWLAQWRAIETRRSLVRVTNTGLTSVINARGELTDTLPLFTPDLLIAKVAVLEGETVYARYGDWFPWTLTLVTLVVIAMRRKGED